MGESMERTSGGVNRGPLVALSVFVILCIIGVISAYHLTGVFVGTHMASEEYDSFCNLSERVNCEQVAASDQYSLVLNVPVSVWATAGFVFVAFLALLALVRRKEGFGQGFLFLFGILFLAVSIWLIVVMHFFIKSWCIVCLAIDVVNLTLFGLSIALVVMSGRSLKEAVVSDFRRTFTSWKLLLPLVVVGVGSLGGAYAFGAHLMSELQAHNDEVAQQEAAEERKKHSIWADAVESGDDQEMVYIPAEDGGKKGSTTEPKWSEKIDDTPLEKSCEEKSAIEAMKKKERKAAVSMGVSDEGYPWIGAADPSLEIMEFTDFQCPYCRRAHMIVRKLANKYPDKLRVYHRQLPLDHHCNPMVDSEFHPRACELARISECAGEQGRFWEMNDYLFHHQREIKAKKLSAEAIAERLALDMGKFECCMGAESSLKPIKRDLNEAIDKGLRGTPAYLINGQVYYGKIPDEALEQLENGQD